MEMRPVSVVIPACDEEGSVVRVLEDVRAALAGTDPDIVVVDDGSGDRTAELALAAGARVLRHPVNRGYGASLKTGIRAALHETIVITDADGTYPASAIPALLEALDTADMAVGSRTGANVHIPAARRPGKWVIRHLTQYVTGMQVPDFNSGLRAFRRSLAERYHRLLPDRFSFTTTITLASLCSGLRVEFLPIDYHPRVGRSKLTAKSFFSFTWLILRLAALFRPLKVFVPASLACLAVGLAKLAWDFAVAARMAGTAGELAGMEVVSVTSILFLLSSLQIALVGLLAEAVALRDPPGRSRPGGGEDPAR